MRSQSCPARGAGVSNSTGAGGLLDNARRRGDVAYSNGGGGLGRSTTNALYSK